MNSNIQELNRQLGIKRIVIWGFKTVFTHSHRFIHGGFYSTLKKLDIPTVWIDDSFASAGGVQSGDLVFAMNEAMTYLPVIKGVKYCLHNAPRNFIDQLDKKDYVLLQVLIKERFDDPKNQVSEVNTLLEGAANYNEDGNILHQSWGAPLLAREFYRPKNLEYKKSEYFVGTIWDNEEGQGNSKVIPIYKAELQRFGVKFLHVQGAPEFTNPLYVRHSAVGASIVGNWQKEVGYAPCRLFKAVSFGRLGIINSSHISDPYPWAISNENIPDLLDSVFTMNPNKSIELIEHQQSFVKKETYENKIKNILKVLVLNQHNCS